MATYNMGEIMYKNLLVLVLFAGTFLTGSGQATLLDRGSGLIYDTDMNLTWMKNANLASTNSFGVSGINVDGSMDWKTANAWVTAINQANYLDYHDWRLPTTQLPHISCARTFDGYDLNCSSIETGHLFYEELGNKAPYNSLGVFQSDYGLANLGPFINLEPKSYWSSTEWWADSDVAYRFNFGNGGLDETLKSFSFPRAWAVRDGDVSPIPEPNTNAMILAGICLIGFVVRNRQHTKAII